MLAIAVGSKTSSAQLRPAAHSSASSAAYVALAQQRSTVQCCSLACPGVPCRAVRYCSAMLCGVVVRSRNYCCTYQVLHVESQKNALTAQLSQAIAQQRSAVWCCTVPCFALRCCAVLRGALFRTHSSTRYNAIPGTDRCVCMYVRVYSSFFSLSSFDCPLSVLAQILLPPPKNNYCCNISLTLLLVYSVGSMRPLCCNQPETLTQGYYPRVDSMVINAAPHRTESSYPGKINTTTSK